MNTANPLARLFVKGATVVRSVGLERVDPTTHLLVLVDPAGEYHTYKLDIEVMRSLIRQLETEEKK